MKTKQKSGCEECSRNVRNIHVIEGKYLCYHCKLKYIHRIGAPMLFEDYIKIHTPLSVGLTKEQKKRLNQRVTKLFGKYKGNISRYIRTLILADLENESRRKTKEDSS